MTIYKKHSILNNMKKIGVIIAGGRGERFWPKSRVEQPKQFLSLTDNGKSMIQLTAERLEPLIAKEDLFVVTNEIYKDLVKDHISGINENYILCEPCARNTAPAIALAAMHIQKKYDDALMVILPADHLIKNKETYQKNVQQALDIAQEGEHLVTLGIVPTYPETGYGYLEYKGNVVVRFVEKPNVEKATEYLAQGDFLWNSGQFFWKASTILDCFKKYSPTTYEHIQNIGNAIGTDKEQEVLEKEFPLCTSESIDFGIMEKAEHVYTIPANFDWDDVGSWLSLERTKTQDANNNVVDGNVVTYNTKNCIIQGNKKLISTVGLEDCIIIDTEDALFICKKDQNQDVKKITELLRNTDKTEYL